MKADVLDDSAGRNVFAAEFELGFDEDEKRGVGFCAGSRRGKDFCDGDERNIGDDKINEFGDVGGLEFAGVALDGDDSRVLPEFPRELGEVHVDGVDARGAMLQKAIREATGGAANIEADEAGGIYCKIFESAFELQAAAARVF